MAKPARRRPASPSGSDSGSYSRSRSRSRSISRSRSRSYSGSDSRSSRSRSRSRSFSSSSSPSRSGSSRRPSPAPPRKSPADGVKRGRSPPPQNKKPSPPPRKASPVPESLVLHVDQLSRNVNEHHLKEIFGNFGEVVNVRLAIDHVVNLPKGFAYVEFKSRADAEKAQLYMDGAQIDGKVVRAKFTLPERKKVASPPKAVPSTSRRDAPKSDDAAADADKDGLKRPREVSPRRKPLSPPRRRSPVGRRGSPRREPDSPPLPRRRADSPARRRADSPYRRDSPLPRRRPPSPPRGRSPSSPPRRYRSPPRASPRRMRGSPVRRRSPLPPRRRSPRRARSPPRRSPVGRRRSRSPVRRPARSPSRSPSLRRGRGPPARRGRSSSYSSSPSPRKGPQRISRSRSPRRVILSFQSQIGVRCYTWKAFYAFLMLFRLNFGITYHAYERKKSQQQQHQQFSSSSWLSKISVPFLDEVARQYILLVVHELVLECLCDRTLIPALSVHLPTIPVHVQ
ncbi:UNVERIFIED_CONTAM: Serine/arginine-rich splicing factor SR45 [Sesamum indicum]